MALIEFQDLPNTDTPINAENLNNNFNMLAEKNIMTALLSSDTQYTSGTTTNKLVLSKYNSVGEKLSISDDGGIKIGSGISKVLVSGAARLQNNNEENNAAYNLYIYKNNLIVGNGRVGRVASGIADGIAVTPTLVSVTEGDIIYLGFWKSESDIATVSGNIATKLTVEAIS